jgi:hypothetical protein
MARVAVGSRSSAVPTAARGPSVYATAASGRLTIREIGVFNTTTTAAAVGIGVATAAGTQGAGLTEGNVDDQTHTVLGTAFNTHTADATIGAVVRQGSLGAAIGAGVIFTFGEKGLTIDEGTGNGVVITCPTGTGQHIDFYIEWEE